MHKNFKNLKRIIAFAVAAVSAATVLSCTVCAGYVDDWETVVDKSGLVQVYRMEEQDKDNPSIGHVFYTDKDNNKLNGRMYANFSDEYSVAPNFLLVEFKDGTNIKYVSGFTKSSKGKRYYIKGERAYGWHKIKGYWYHFDIKSGYMDTGKTTIGGAVYTFDKNGRWTYRVSKDGIAPKDFSVRFIGGPSNGFDTAEKKLFYGWNENGTAEASVKISARDRQILWCMYLESGFEQGSSEVFDDDYMTDFCKSFFHADSEVVAYSSLPEIVYDITVNVGDTSAKIEYNTDSDQIALIDEKTFRADLLYNGYSRYLAELEEKYPYTGEPLMMLE